MLNAEVQRPKLVVGIVVDQLRTDYIEYLQNLFGEKGFRKLMKDGVYLRDVDFGIDNLDIANATSIIYTGAYPASSGVTGLKVFDPATRQMLPALYDNASIGNYTNDTYSPAPLRLSTISDELAIEGDGFNGIYAIAPEAQQAIIMAGHAGNSAFWLNENTGQWATTTYYKDVPSPIGSRNYGQSVASRIDGMAWKPLRDIESYPGLPVHKRLASFNHRFSRADKDVYRMFSATPLANEEVTDLAIDYIKDLRLGTRGNVMDMLNLGYTTAPYKYVKDGDSRAELTDAYVRLDAQLERLFDAIDKYVGLNNAVVFLSSTGYFNDATQVAEKYRLPGGDFSKKRSESLLNSFLTAKYGNRDYVKGFYGNNIFLDHDVIEAAGLDVATIAAESRDFLCRMSGVETAYTLRDVLEGSSDAEQRLRRTLDPKRSGDIYVEYAPGWNVVDDMTYPPTVTPMRQSMVMSPAFIFSPTVAATTVDTPVDATQIAPTVANVLRIRSPNGSQSRPLSLQFKNQHNQSK